MNLKDIYEKDVLRKVFPEFNFTDNIYTEWHIDDGENKKSICVPGNIYNKSLRSSHYYLTDKTYFIHYTSLEAACAIVQQNRIRLNELNQVNDPLEIKFAKELVGVGDDALDMYVEGYDNPNGNLKSQVHRNKERLFTFSLCNVCDLDTPDRFEMWRSYAGDGKGVAIIFEIDNRNRNDWYNFHLSNVYYGDNVQTEILKRFIECHRNFERLKESTFYNFQYFVSSFLAYHKSIFYKEEKEVRLLTKGAKLNLSSSLESEFQNHLDFDLSWNIRKSRVRNCVYLNLNNSYEYANYKHLKKENIPFIKIKQILLGYDNSEYLLKEFRLLVNNSTIKHGEPRINVEFTRLKRVLGFD